MALFEKHDGNINSEGANILSKVSEPIESLMIHYIKKDCFVDQISALMMTESFNIVQLIIFGGPENSHKLNILEQESLAAEQIKLDESEGHLLYKDNLMNNNAMILVNKFGVIIAEIIKENYMKKESIQEIAYIILSAVNAARVTITYRAYKSQLPPAEAGGL